MNDLRWWECVARVGSADPESSKRYNRPRVGFLG